MENVFASAVASDDVRPAPLVAVAQTAVAAAGAVVAFAAVSAMVGSSAMAMKSSNSFSSSFFTCRTISSIVSSPATCSAGSSPPNLGVVSTLRSGPSSCSTGSRLFSPLLVMVSMCSFVVLSICSGFFFAERKVWDVVSCPSWVCKCSAVGTWVDGLLKLIMFLMMSRRTRALLLAQYDLLGCGTRLFSRTLNAQE